MSEHPHNITQVTSSASLDHPPRCQLSASSQQNKTLTSLEVFRAFIIKGHNDLLDASGLLSFDCFSLWLSSRGHHATNEPARKFRRALIAHLTGTDGRTPFSQEEEQAVLKAVRIQAPWQCFNHLHTTKRPLMGFRSRGFHEKRFLGESFLPIAKKRAKYLPETRGASIKRPSNIILDTPSPKSCARSTADEYERSSNIGNMCHSFEIYSASAAIKHQEKDKNSHVSESSCMKKDIGEKQDEQADETSCTRTIVNLKTIRQVNSIAGSNIDTEAASLRTLPEWESKILMDDDSFEKLDNLDGIFYNTTQFSDVFVSPKNSTAIVASPSPWTSYFGSSSHQL